MMSGLAERLTACKLEIERLKAAIESTRRGLCNGGIKDIEVGASYRVLGGHLKRRRALQGHHGKVYAADWAPDGNRLVSTG